MAHLGFPFQNGDSSNAKIDIKVAPYRVELQSLYHLIPSLFATLNSKNPPITAKESRTRIVKQYASTPFEELAAYATEVFKHKQASLRGAPTAEQWAGELLLWQKEHAVLQKGY